MNLKTVVMTEEKLYERLMNYKSKYGVTLEVWQHYNWALELLRQQHPEGAKTPPENV